MKHIVNFSGGDCSFWAAHRVVEKHGAKDTVLLFADTLIEDQSLYEFNERSAQILGVPITRVCYGLTPWQLFRKEGLIGNNRLPICSVRLKREPLNEWMAENFELIKDQGNFLKDHATVYLGFDWTEEHRVQDMRREHPEWLIEAPMQEEPIWDKCKMRREAEALGLPEQRLYSLGFPHNNCGGACVRAGITHFVHLYRVLPSKFLEWENEEAETIEEFKARGIEPLTMLKDRRGGVTKSLTLRELRFRIEAGEKFPMDEWGGCGCGGVAKEAA